MPLTTATPAIPRPFSCVTMSDVIQPNATNGNVTLAQNSASKA